MEHYTMKELLLTLTTSFLLTIAAYYAANDKTKVEYITFSEPVMITPTSAR